jgi:HlyD family secretion protein
MSIDDIMDIARPDLQKKKTLKKRIIIITSSVAFIGFVVFVLTLGAPMQSVKSDQIWVGEVKRGTMERNLRGMGKLTPENMRWITARAAGRVEDRYVLSGAKVEAGTPILKLSNPELQQSLADAKLELESAEAEMAGAEVRLKGELLALKSSVVELQETTEMAEIDSRIQDQLFAQRLVSDLNRERAELHAKHSRKRLEMDEERLSFQESSMGHQLASQRTRVDRARAQVTLLQGQVDALVVRAGFAGILQRLELEPGQRAEQDAMIAQVADMTALKAVVEIQEAQAREVTVGQNVTVDTRTSGEVKGKVARVDPNVENGIVKVDVHFDTALPPGCRAEQTVQGTIELERLDNVVYVSRPASAQGMSTATIFLMNKAKNEAMRVPVTFGKASVSEIEIQEGLNPGDNVILSDTSRWDSAKALEIE